MASSAKRSPPVSPLLAAAQAFDGELTSYLHLSESFQRAPMTTNKQLERVNELLGQIAESEQRLAICGQQLAEAVSGAREQQEQQARITLGRIPEVKARMDQLRALLARFEELGLEATAINQTAVNLGRVGQAGAGGDEAAAIGGARELAANMHALSVRASELAAAAREADFEELAARAHGLHQQLLSAHHKLKLAVVG
jgi:hypothetical protein